MSDGDNDHSLFVATTTIASILLAGSAYLWRANLRLPIPLLGPPQRPPQVVSADPSDPAIQPSSASDPSRADTEKPKSPRSKERRRRGKDPFRDILKNGKKLKALSKIIPTENTKTTPVSTAEPPQSQSFQNMSLTSSSSSRSASSSTSRTRPAQQPEPTQDGNDQAGPVQPSGVTVSGAPDERAESSVPPPELDPARDSLATQVQRSHSHSDSPLQSHATTQGPSSTSVVQISITSASPQASPDPALLSPSTTTHAPRRTLSTGTNTPPPSLSTQTQLASLRGALEAARQREAQMKSDLDRYAKELEFVRWENAAWRRRELELQTQVNYLAHQLQTVATSFSPIPRSAPSTSSPAPPSNGPGTSSSSSSNSSSSANASPAKNGYHLPLPSQNNSQQPIALPHIIPPSMTPSGMFSPVSMMRPVSSPVYYAYPPVGAPHPHHHHPNYSHFSPQMQPHAHSFPLSPTQPVANQVNFMSVFPTNGSAGPSSNTISPSAPSSVGSLSPDCGNLATTVDRGRRKARGNMQMGGWSGFSEEDDGYVQEGGAYYEISDEDENEVSEALADAILKRPESLRLGMGRGRKLRSSPMAELATDKSSPGSESQAEFTFPSLSDLGNVNWGKRNVDKDYESLGVHPTDAEVNGDIISIAKGGSSSLEEGLEKAEQLDLDAHKSPIEDSLSGASGLPAG